MYCSIGVRSCYRRPITMKQQLTAVANEVCEQHIADEEGRNQKIGEVRRGGLDLVPDHDVLEDLRRGTYTSKGPRRCRDFVAVSGGEVLALICLDTCVACGRS